MNYTNVFDGNIFFPMSTAVTDIRFKKAQSQLGILENDGPIRLHGYLKVKAELMQSAGKVTALRTDIVNEEPDFGAIGWML